MLPPLRIAILECDELTGETKKDYGSISNVYKKFLEAGASKLEASGLYDRPSLDISSYDVVNKQEYPDTESIDAVFLTGSPHFSLLVQGYDSFTPGENDWISKLVDFIKVMLQNQSRVRIMAVCFGHQIVGRAYGVMPERNDAGWEVSVTPMVLTERGKQVFEQDSLALHQMHRDILPRYPPYVEKLGHSDLCDVQGIYVKNRVITLQGHPEYNTKIASGEDGAAMKDNHSIIDKWPFMLKLRPGQQGAQEGFDRSIGGGMSGKARCPTIMAASDPEAQPWGYITYRTVYTPESNAVWDSVTTKLENYMSNSPSPGCTKGGKWAAPHLWYMNNATLYNGLSINQVRDDFTNRVRDSVDLFNQGAYEEFSWGVHDWICLVIDEEVIYSIINDAPEDVSEAERLFNCSSASPKQPIPYVKAVGRDYDPPDPNKPPRRAPFATHREYRGWMKAGLLWIGAMYHLEEMEVECPGWDPALGDEAYPVY
ncbi:class I glutamine amidotransferase-like protein [Arthroderma uncinatum]|uniref:class I glutamine amidotransferase-like protein n=1 Tax=Arthroderma uncinatum TaxID=74035 RepID=UPI00144ABFAF|nr:class I glutamine amidotransferase-like protein [Arthroderma uncinatum]KAF3480032.1 class I glutamine amidotransferase-like protein [Arthroderma uncinatum]